LPCIDHGIDFNVWLCSRAGDTRLICASSTFGDFYLPPHTFWDFHLTTRQFLGISALPPVTIRDSHFTARWMGKGRFPTLQPLLTTKLSVQA